MAALMIAFWPITLFCFFCCLVRPTIATSPVHYDRARSSSSLVRQAVVIDAEAEVLPVSSSDGDVIPYHIDDVAPLKRSPHPSPRFAREELATLSMVFDQKAPNTSQVLAQRAEADPVDPQSNQAANAMMVKMNGEGDTAALASSAIFTFTICVFTVVAFCILRTRYPEIYSHRVVERTAPPGQFAIGAVGHMDWVRDSHSLTADEVIGSTGLDSWMFLELQGLGSQISSWLCPLAFVLLPLHWFNGGRESSSDYLSRLSLSVVVDPNLSVVWIHAGVVWFVVLATTHLLFGAQRRFLARRFEWLRGMPEPQATTLLVEGIPEAYRSDKHLHAYFVDMFSEQAILSVYVVRDTRRLLELQEQLESASKALLEVEQQWAAAGSPSDQRPKLPLLAGLQLGEDAIEAYTAQISELDAAVTSERNRLSKGKVIADPLVCSSTGFVTFRTRRDARMASKEQLRSDDGEFVLSPAPHPDDVLYANLLDSMVESMMAPAATSETLASAPECHDQGANSLAEGGRTLTRLVFRQELYGWACFVALFAAWTPIVVFISGLTSLNALQQYMPTLIGWLTQFPILHALIEGVLVTFGLNMLMGMLPWILLLIVQRFFKLKAGSWAQLWLERLYFVFLFVFVLLVTALGRGVLDTLASAANNPTSVLTLFARTLPMASHFYIGYVISNWFSTFSELLRLGVLFKYFSFKVMVDNEDARKSSEEESVYVGPRVSLAAMTMVIALVFSSLSPLILIVAWVYFRSSRTVYGYMCCFAEPTQPDLGGVFWVDALKQIHSGLFVYILLMLGVISAHSDGHLGPFVFVLPALIFSAVAWRRFDSQYLWESLPLEDLVQIDESRKVSGLSRLEVGSYVQPELLTPDSQGAVVAG